MLTFFVVNPKWVFQLLLVVVRVALFGLAGNAVLLNRLVDADDLQAEQIAVEILGVAGSLHRVMERFGGHMALVRAERSAMTPADVERFQRTRPDAAVIGIAGAGHLVARDQPSELATVLTDTAADWLASTPIAQVPRNDAMRVAQPDGSSIQGA